MTETIHRKIICDNCGEDLIIHSSYPAKYSLELRAVDTNLNDTGVVYAVHVSPPINGKLHFCNRSCLKEWCEKEVKA